MPNSRRFRKPRLSKGKRKELLSFYEAVFSRNGDTKLPAKKSTAVAKNEKVDLSLFSYTDSQGITQTLDLSKVKNLGDTAYAESQRLFPDAVPCMIAKDGTQFDSEGRENVLGENLVLLEARRMNSGEYGPSFLLRAIRETENDEGETINQEISVFAPGTVVNGAIEQLSGIALKDKVDPETKIETKAGDKFGPSEFPVMARFDFLPGKGEYNGYFVISPASLQSDE